MFVHNITIKIDNTILPEWIKWIRDEYIPAVMATDLFNDYKMFELLHPGDEADSSTFVLQYFTDSKENYNEFMNKHSSLLHQTSLKRWEDNFIAFSSLLRTVH